jgi:hypothetical protein
MVADTYRATELCQTNDYTGEVISEDKRTRYCALLPITCNSPDGDIDVGMTVYVELPIAKVAGIPKDDSQRLHTVAYHSALNVKNRLERADTWELYGTEHVTFYGDDPFSIPASFDVKCDAEITGLLATHFRVATKRHEEVEKALEKAKEYLENGLDYGARHDSSRISSAAHFIADCMRADGTPMMSAWNDEKSAVLLAHIADLIKRKDPNHRNYKSMVNWIHSTLYSVRSPTFWARYPPQPHLLNLK